MRWYNHGDPLWRPATLDERFWAKVDQSGGADACWPWLGYVEAMGYGRVNRDGPKWAHRVAYELVRGPIPDGFDLDHICHDPLTCFEGPCPHRQCVNPAHLEPATTLENTAPHRRRSPRNRLLAGVGT